MAGKIASMRFHTTVVVVFAMILASGEAFNAVVNSHVVSNISTQHSREYIKYNEERGEASVSASSTLREMLAKIGRKADVEDLINHPALQTAIEYLEKRKIGKLPRAENSFIKELIGSYGVDGVARIIEEGNRRKYSSIIEEGKSIFEEGMSKDSSIVEEGKSKDSSIKTLIKRIQSEFMQFLIENKSPGDVFKLLKLDEQGESLFQSPLLNTWKDYVDTYNEFHHEHISLFATLKEQFNAEKQDELIRMLFDAKMRRIKKTVRRMRAEQSRTWLSRGIPPDDIFDLLELRNDKFARMDGQRFTAWKKYADKFYSRFSDEEHDPMHILQKKYGYQFLVKMIIDAEKIPKTQHNGKNAEEDLFMYWAKRYLPQNVVDPPIADAVFSALQLDKNEKPFNGPLFYTWISFILFFESRVPDFKIDLLTTLTKLLGEDKLIKSFTSVEEEDMDFVKDIVRDLSNDSLREKVPRSVLAMVYGDKDIRKRLRKRKRDD
ncbi:hypothetical protein PsorP6_004949 [Peronosclerospora sorghi]|uniref:Uncharacterized protein n=1 Tax=Peronosclerospora sorghi TaxID=230839 RepID=A0ACC0W5Y9_9STRA|nr:hypothetical protein PsorP6_004949 [Peronosclerospora sorghi]